MKRSPSYALALATACIVLASCGGSRATSTTTPGAGTSPATSATAPTVTPVAATAGPTATPEPVPAEFSAMYDSLASNLDAWQTAISNVTPASPSATVFGAHVLAANGNRGDALLAPTTMPLVDQTLDALKRLGVGGVTVTVSFPLLNADYPRSADYLKFYETFAQHVRDRGLKLTVEQHIVFHGTAFSSVDFDFSSLGFEAFETQFHTMAQTIIDRMHPDYLTLLSEPDTFVRLTGYRQALGPANSAAMIDTVVSGLQRGSTKIGAGTGSWLPDAAGYAKAFAASPSLDYVDLHIYPIAPNTIANAQAVVDAARAAGKPVVLDEAWLYKLAPGEGAAMSFDQNEQIFRRDLFGFWAPLDARFLTLVAQFARANGIAYVAPFWSNYFWAYATYDATTKDLAYAQLSQQANRSVLQALQRNTLTQTGEAWRAAASQ